MNKKIMDLIDLAMQFKMGGSIIATVEFASHVNSVSISILINGKTIYMEHSYLDWENADEKLDIMKAELEKYLNQSLKEVV